MSANGSNVADLVRAAARRGPDHPALIDAETGTTHTWAAVDAAVDAQARRLVEAGAHQGHRIMVRLATGPEFCVALLGVLRAGCVAVPVSPGAPAREVARLFADSGAALVIGQADDLGAGVPATGVPATGVPATGVPATGVPATGVPAAPEPSPESWSGFTARGGGEDVAVLAYTSGAHDVARGVMLSHRALLANVEQYAALRPAPVTGADRVFLAVPLFHRFGLGPGLLQVAAAGATAVFLQRFDARRALAAVERYRVTTIVGVPSRYRALLRLPEEQVRHALTTVRLLTSGGARLDPDLLDAIQRVTGLGVYETYGLSETGPVVTTTLVTGRPKAASVGRPLPGVELRLVDVDGRPLAELAEAEIGVDVGGDEHGTGLVAVRGPNLFSGYWPDGAEGPDADGWFRTADVGYWDDDGDLRLVDRVGDLIVVSGFNVYPREVEHVLDELPEVAEAAAVGVPDEATGQAVKAVLVVRPGAALSTEQVLDHCTTRLAKFKVPSMVTFVDALPRTPTGKVARSELRRV